MNRFTSEEQIIKLIDKFRGDIAGLNQQAAELDHLADCLKTTAESHRIPRLRERAETIRNQVAWREGRLKTLGEKLAEFRTPQLPIIDNGDTSIPTA